MTRFDRRPTGHPLPLLVALFVTLALAAAACSPASGPLGTPATPPASAEPSIEIPSSDVTPPASPTTTPTPTFAPTTTPGASEAPSSGSSPTPARTPVPTATPGGSTIVRAYFFLGSFTGSGGLAPVLREVMATKAVARAAMTQLLAGPSRDELAARPAFYTSIPDATRLLDISISDGVATVDLSAAYATAMREFKGGQADAQVVYTLTQFPTVKSVRILVDGQVHLGGATRADYQLEGLLPAIFVDRPAWGAALGNPGAVAGLANVFEATFRVQVLDATGDVIADRQVMASCGTGCWGTFKERIAYDVNQAQWGTLRVFNLSARDGAPENVTEYPVWLTPAG
jgi:hypothetical protein